MSRLLIIEDDASLALSLKKFLEAEGFEIKVVHTLKEARGAGANHDLVILDWMLPDGQGIDYLHNLRKENDKLPVIFLTAKSELIDKVLGLESGAHDYMVKPFEPRELLARIRVHLRMKTPFSEELKSGPVSLDLASRELSFLGKKIETTRKEFDLLAVMLAHPSRVFTREELLNKVWGFDNFPTTRTVDTHVLQIRQKTHDGLIETFRGIGYRLRTDKDFT